VTTDFTCRLYVCDKNQDNNFLSSSYLSDPVGKCRVSGGCLTPVTQRTKSDHCQACRDGFDIGTDGKCEPKTWPIEDIKYPVQITLVQSGGNTMIKNGDLGAKFNVGVTTDFDDTEKVYFYTHDTGTTDGVSGTDKIRFWSPQDGSSDPKWLSDKKNTGDTPTGKQRFSVTDIVKNSDGTVKMTNDNGNDFTIIVEILPDDFSVQLTSGDNTWDWDVEVVEMHDDHRKIGFKKNGKYCVDKANTGSGGVDCTDNDARASWSTFVQEPVQDTSTTDPDLSTKTVVIQGQNPNRRRRSGTTATSSYSEPLKYCKDDAGTIKCDARKEDATVFTVNVKTNYPSAR